MSRDRLSERNAFEVQEVIDRTFRRAESAIHDHFNALQRKADEKFQKTPEGKKLIAAMTLIASHAQASANIQKKRNWHEGAYAALQILQRQVNLHEDISRNVVDLKAMQDIDDQRQAFSRKLEALKDEFTLSRASADLTIAFEKLNASIAALTADLQKVK